MVLDLGKSSVPCDCGGLCCGRTSRCGAGGRSDLGVSGPGFAWKVLSDCQFCLYSLEHRGPPSGTNSARQSPAPQHRPLGSSADRYRAVGFGRRNRGQLERLGRGTVNSGVTTVSFYLCAGELRKGKLEKKFPVVTGFPGPSTSTWHSRTLALLQSLVAVTPRYRYCRRTKHSALEALQWHCQGAFKSGTIKLFRVRRRWRSCV